MRSLPSFFFGVVFLLSGCTHETTPENKIRSDCSWESLPDEPSWVFLKCELKNEADVTQKVVLKPEIPEGLDELEEPNAKDLDDLQQRLKKRSAGVAPHLSAGTSNRPEIFIAEAIVTVGTVLLQTQRQNNAANVSLEHKVDLKAGEKQVLLFPLKGQRKTAPERLTLHFTQPNQEKRKQEIPRDAMDIRSRPPR